MSGFKISYEPLFITLDERSLKLVNLKNDLSISDATLAKFSKGETVSLETLGKICSYLRVPIEQVVRIDF